MGFGETDRPTFSTVPLLNHQYRTREPGAPGWAPGSSGGTWPCVKPELMGRDCQARVESKCCLGVSECVDALMRFPSSGEQMQIEHMNDIVCLRCIHFDSILKRYDLTDVPPVKNELLRCPTMVGFSIFIVIYTI